MIHIYLDSDTLEVGEKLSGSCLWTPTSEEGKKNLNLTIGWRTEGRGDVDKETIYEIEIPASARTYFSCQIPITGPVSYDGNLLRIIWEIVVTKSKFLGFKDTLKSQFFQVVPRSLH